MARVRSTDVLGEGGPLARALPGYERRDAQLRMAEMVEQVLEHEGIALIEAGTGTGKTLAYLVPAILSGKRVVISTGTKTLQDQLMDHDLPLLASHLGVPLRAACLKGLNNYVCLRRYTELRRSRDAGLPATGRKLEVLAEWLERTESGDRAELDAIAEEDPIWAAVQSDTTTRIGARCAHFDACFVTRARRRAEKASLLVVNHHLFFADLATRGPHGGGVLPDYDAVIFDEAHQIEDIATDFFGAQLSDHRLQALGRDAARALDAAGLLDAEAERVLRTLESTTASFFSSLPRAAGAEGRGELATRSLDSSRHHALDAALEALALRCQREAGASETILHLARRADRVRDELARIVDGSERGSVTWIDARGRSLRLGSSPVDVSELFREQVLWRVPSIVFTSATLSAGGSFDFVKRRLGVEREVDEAVLPSPFDYARQAALYLPSLPDPREPAWIDHAESEIARLVELTGGGAFVLCTSTRAMTRLAERCRIARPVLVQGRASKTALLERFRAEGDAVLFATASFWEGVDVPGEALRLVIIDKLPFDVPSDPLVRARCQRIEEQGEAPFARYLLPAAALALKQGFGRLIRTTRDRGIVAILDPRIRTKGYGKVFLRTLPPATRCDTFAEVEGFYAPS
ncbi:MAG: ATP-dependent DNA helicase [Sandaracinaceae bacterium]|nr:ATP-dependent DNA helicase [Sandaracinaceae bacterium]